MHFLLHKALASSAILCTVPQIHLQVLPNAFKEGFPPYLGTGLESELKLTWLFSSLYERYISSSKRSTLWQDKTGHDRVEIFRLHLLFIPTPRMLHYAKQPNLQILHAPLAGASMWEKFCLGTKCQSHTHIKIVLDLLWQPAASGKHPMELSFSQEMTERKKGTITFPIFGPNMDAASQRSHLLIDSPARHCLNFNFHKLPFSAFWAAGALVHFHQSVPHFKRVALPRD